MTPKGRAVKRALFIYPSADSVYILVLCKLTQQPPVFSGGCHFLPPAFGKLFRFSSLLPEKSVVQCRKVLWEVLS